MTATLTTTRDANVSRKCLHKKGSPLVLGAGGWNIFHHFGVLEALAEQGIEAGEVLGVSAGSMTAAFFANGYKPADMIPVFLSMRNERWNPASVLSCLRIADPLSMTIGGPISIRPFVERLVKEYGLKPQPNLKIVACDFFTREPVVFEGTDYDLVTALSASCSVPGVFQPIWHFQNGRMMLLVDGAVYHYSPTEFFDAPAIVSKFSKATEMPREWQHPADLYFHFRELFFPLAGNNRYVDASRNLVIETGMPEVAGLNFGISEKTCLEMVANGYNIASRILKEACQEGRFCECGASSEE